MNALQAVQHVRNLLANKLIAKKYARRVLKRVAKFLKTKVQPKNGFFAAAERLYIRQRAWVCTSTEQDKKAAVIAFFAC